jgi:hypothetical protein
MPGAFDQEQAGTGQGPRQPGGGGGAHHRVAGISEQQGGGADRWERRHQSVQFTEQGTLLGEKGAPQGAVLAAGAGPDFQVGMPGRAARRPAAPGQLGQPGPGDARGQLPRHPRAERARDGGGQQPVPHVEAARADARQQDHSFHPVRGQARRGQGHPAAVGVPHQDRPLDAAGVKLTEHGLGTGGEPAGGLLAGSVAGPVHRDGVQLGGQPRRYLLPVGRQARLAVQQHQRVRAPQGAS